MKREELIEYLRAYPGVTSVSKIQSDDAPEWSTLELLFDDGTKLNLNPDVLSTSDTDDIDIGATEKILQALNHICTLTCTKFLTINTIHTTSTCCSNHRWL